MASNSPIAKQGEENKKKTPLTMKFDTIDVLSKCMVYMLWNKNNKFLPL
jgi:hypothetical protein